MSKKIILITGGTGYIGSHAVVAFEQAGYQTVILDSLINSSRDSLSGIEKILGYCPDFYECDIRDREGLNNIFSRYEFDGVIHFAGLKVVKESCDTVGLYHENNITGSIILFSLMEDFWVRNIVFSSSATVYSSVNLSPIHEDMELDTTNPYWTTKLVIEKILWDYAIQKNWNVINLRYFNPIGAHISGFIGEVSSGVPTNILPYVLDVAIGKRKEVFVFGNDYNTPDGTGVRDYVDINDLVEAHVVAYSQSMKSSWVYTYNIGTWRWISVLELIDEVSVVSGNNISISIAARRKWDLPLVLADVSKIQKELWWSAKYAFHDSIASAWKFMKNWVE